MSDRVEFRKNSSFQTITRVVYKQFDNAVSYIGITKEIDMIFSVPNI